MAVVMWITVFVWNTTDIADLILAIMSCMKDVLCEIVDWVFKLTVLLRQSIAMQAAAIVYSASSYCSTTLVWIMSVIQT